MRTILGAMASCAIVATAVTTPLRLDPDGQFEVEPTCAPIVRLETPQARLPIIRAHAGGLICGMAPEGRPAWHSAWMERRVPMR